MASERTVEDFRHDYEFAPTAWAAFIFKSGLGVRGSAMSLDTAASLEAFHPGVAPGGTLRIESARPLGVSPLSITDGPTELMFESDLELRVYDLEVVQVYEPACWSLVFFGGARRVAASQSYHVTMRSAVPPGSIMGIRSGHNFRGIGPTFGLEAHRPLGQSGFGLYGSARGAVLFGKTKQDALLIDFGADGSTVTIVESARDSRREVLPITEYEIGAEYVHPIGDCGAYLFVQGAAVGHVYYGIGNAANSGNVGDSGSLEPDSSVNLGLLGFKIMAGINF